MGGSVSMTKSVAYGGKSASSPLEQRVDGDRWDGAPSEDCNKSKGPRPLCSGMRSDEGSPSIQESDKGIVRASSVHKRLSASGSGSGAYVMDTQNGLANDEVLPARDDFLFTTPDSGHAHVVDELCCGVGRRILVDPESDEEFLSQCEGERPGDPDMLIGFKEGFKWLVDYPSSE